MPTKQKSGLYRTKVKIGTNEHGREIVKWVSGKTKKELEDAKREVVERYIGGTGLRKDRLFGEYATQWYHTIKEPLLSEASKANYRTMLNKHVFSAFGDRNIRAITASDLQHWINGFAGMSGTTIAQAATVITGIFAAATADRIVSADPSAALKLPKAKKDQQRRDLTEGETQKMLWLINNHEHGDYLACLFYTGARPGEVRGLIWGILSGKLVSFIFNATSTIKIARMPEN